MSAAAIGIVFNSKKQILLVQRQDVPVWVLPGGGIDFGESPEAAAIREVLEETGLKTHILRKVAEYTPINRLSNPAHVFECTIESGSLLTGSETRSIQFYDLDQLPHALFFVHRDWIKDALLNQKDVIRKPINQVTYLAVIKYFCRKPFEVLRFLYTRLFS